MVARNALDVFNGKTTIGSGNDNNWSTVDLDESEEQTTLVKPAGGVLTVAEAALQTATTRQAELVAA